MKSDIRAILRENWNTIGIDEMKSKFLGIVAFLGFVLAGVYHPQSIAREVFGQSPASIHQMFGQYWTRLTEELNSGDRQVTYAYSPYGIKKRFPKAQLKNFEVVFSNNQATSISAWMSLGLSRFSDNGYPLEFNSLFTYFFDRPLSSSVYQKLIYDGSQEHGSLRQMHFCVDTGILMVYEYASVRDNAIYIRYSLDERCQESYPTSSTMPNQSS
ncbi:hypothetical protein [Acaryochloris sp. IP29b_bin.137]|uniref:hypothetical protein n=1 Tax=Acaryochloris sp. IP29b_bin.137 TaxID=2969217 RepID=UPI00260B1580|nr:hypothetical protein [Acaryochloris sp. IP29b_bin.137]